MKLVSWTVGQEKIKPEVFTSNIKLPTSKLLGRTTLSARAHPGRFHPYSPARDVSLPSNLQSLISNIQFAVGAAAHSRPHTSF